MEFIGNFLDLYRNAFMLNQILTILVIFLIGAIVSGIVVCDKAEQNTYDYILRVSLSFPIGLAIVMLVGYVILTLGVKYSATSLIIGVIITCVIIYILNRSKVALAFKIVNIKTILITLAVVVAIATICVSGILKMSVSNDSLYYFWQYPRAIVDFEGLRDQFDNFLTDTGLCASVVGTLPFIFGFGETFGIQLFFHCSFLVFFMASTYLCIKKNYETIDNKKARVISAMSMLIMAVCTPSYILAHWAMSNMYFMEYFYIAVVLLYLWSQNETRPNMVIFAIIMFACSGIRMEGSVFVIFVYLLASARDYTGKWIAISAIPCVMLQSMYQVKIFTSFNIDNPYTFLTVPKAIIQFLAYIAVMVYVLFIRDKLPKRLIRYIPTAIMCGLIAVNFGLLIYDSNIYILNLIAFAGNLTGQSGWGILPHLSIGAVVIIIFMLIVIGRNRKNAGLAMIRIDEPVRYFTYCFFCYVLITLAVSFARGDALNVNTGDSGNRVLLQIAPIAVMTFVMWIISLTNDEAFN